MLLWGLSKTVRSSVVDAAGSEAGVLGPAVLAAGKVACAFVGALGVDVGLVAQPPNSKAMPTQTAAVQVLPAL
jgi:hypothetical protein